MPETVQGPRSVLVVDDSATFRDVLSVAFRRAKSGTTVFPLPDGSSAIDHFTLCGVRYPVPDLVLVDREMPGGPDGYEVMRAARSMQPLARVPLLLLDDTGDEECVTRALAAGADGCLTKSPVQDDYPLVVADTLAWWRERQEKDFLRNSCAMLACPGSPLPIVPVQSSLMTPGAPAAVHEGPLGQFHALLQAVYGYFADGRELQTVGLFADRKLVELTRACREVGIDETDATGRSQDPVLVMKRGRVIRRLMSLEWADTELERRFHLSKRTLVDHRRVWRREQMSPKSCAVLAQGHN